MIKALLFDLDETLTVHEAAYRESYALMGALAARRTGVDGGLLAARAPGVVERVWQSTAGAAFTNRAGFGGRDVLWAGPGDGNEDLRRLAPIVDRFRSDAWTQLLAEQGVSDADLVQELRDRFPVKMWSQVKAFPDAAAALESVGHHYDLALVTNGMPSVQAAKLTHAGLDRFFEHIAVSGFVGEGKPAASIFRAALQMIGKQPQEAVMFGDVPERDILGANRLGIRSVWVNRAGETLAEGAPMADREIADLWGLASLVRSL